MVMTTAVSQVISIINGMQQIYGIEKDGFKVEIYYADIKDIPNVLSLKKAIESGALKVVETGSVHKVVIENKSGQRILLQRGDVIVGGKQNRTILSPILVPANQVFNIPVNCVEAGRWSYSRVGEVVGLRRREFAHIERLPMYLRAKFLQKEVALKTRSEYFEEITSGGQTELWGDINESSEKLAAVNPTSDVVEIIRKAKTDIDKDLEKVPENATIVVYYYRGKIIALEAYFIDGARDIIIDNIKGAYADYLYYERERIETPDAAERVEEIVDELKHSELSEPEKIGEEEVVNIDMRRYVGQIVCIDNKPIVMEIKLKVE